MGFVRDRPHVARLPQQPVVSKSPKTPQAVLLTFSYPKYLESKRTVDERARHPGVWNSFMERLQDLTAHASGREKPLRILEVGGGVGDLAIKIIRTLPGVSVEYTLIDIDRENLDTARGRLRETFPDVGLTPVLNGADAIPDASPTGGNIEEKGGGINVYLVRDDITCLGGSHSNTPIQSESIPRYDAICGQAIMDIVPARILLEKLSLLLQNNGVVYLPIHFDGRTDFDPSYDSQVDQLVSRIYHDSMARAWENAAGNVHAYDGSRSGRDLIMHAAAADLSVVDVGASDWIVLPSEWREGSDSNQYPVSEAYFLQCMLHFIEGELSVSPHITNHDASAWMSVRRQQLADGELAMFVHNLDVLLAPTR